MEDSTVSAPGKEVGKFDVNIGQNSGKTEYNESISNSTNISHN